MWGLSGYKCVTHVEPLVSKHPNASNSGGLGKVIAYYSTTLNFGCSHWSKSIA